MKNSALLRQGGIFTISLGIYFLVLIVLERIGVDQLIASFVTAAYIGLLIIVPSIMGGAIRSNKFFFSERNSGSGILAITTTAVVAVPFMVTLSGYYFFNSPSLIALFSTATSVSVAIFSLLIARPFRQSGATSLANFQINRFNSTIVARLTSIVHLIAGVLLIIASMKLAVNIGSWFFNISQFYLSILFCAAIIFTASYGGITSLAKQSAIAVISLLIAINIPLALESFSQTGLPVGLASFVTTAVFPFFEIEGQLRQEQYKLLDYAMISSSNTTSWTNLNWNVAMVLTALGTVATPTLMQQFTQATSSERASNSGQKTILILGLLFVSIFALMAFLKLSLYETLLGLRADEVFAEAPYLFGSAVIDVQNYTNGLVAVCGEYVNSASKLIAACGGDAGRTIALSDIQFNGDLILTASGMLMGYPYAITGFLVVAILLVIVAFCSATILSISTNIISAYFSSKKEQLASVEISLARFTILLVGLVIFAIGREFQIDSVKLTIFAFGLYTASLLPSLIGSLYWHKINNAGMILSILIGFILTVGIWALGYLGIDLDASTQDQINFLQFLDVQIDPVLSSALALPISVLAMIGFSILGKGKSELPKNDQIKLFVDDIFDDNEERVVIRKNRF